MQNYTYSFQKNKAESQGDFGFLDVTPKVWSIKERLISWIL